MVVLIKNTKPSEQAQVEPIRTNNLKTLSLHFAAKLAIFNAISEYLEAMYVKGFID